MAMSGVSEGRRWIGGGRWGVRLGSVQWPGQPPVHVEASGRKGMMETWTQGLGSGPQKSDHRWGVRGNYPGRWKGNDPKQRLGRGLPKERQRRNRTCRGRQESEEVEPEEAL